jgi:alpha-glucoside transport system substrate-binding protein
MSKRNWWAMSVATVVVVMACSSTPATPAPTAKPPATTTPASAAPGTTTPASVAPATPTAPAATATPAAPTTAPSLAPAVPTVPTGYTELDKALGSDQPFKGTKVTIQVQWIGGEGDNFENSLKDFENATGIDVVVDRVGSSHETVLRTRIEGNDATLNLAMLAQPSAVVAYGKEGKLADVATFMDPTKLTAEHAATLPLVSDGTKVYGVPYKLDVKSTVWYPIKAFAAKGYEVPTTWDQLIALSDKIVADGNGNPWCIGMEAGTATGWQATDWLEDIMLRTAGIDKYNQWITNDLKFDSPEVTTAMDDAGKIFFTPNYVFGGSTGIVAIHQTDPMDPMFPPTSSGNNWDGFTPGCWMQKQATWYGPDFFPDVKANPGTPSQFVLGEDIGLFYFPAIDPAQGTPALGAGDTLMVLAPPDGSAPTDSTKAVAEFLSTPQGTQRWIEAGSAISANTTTPASWYEGYYKLKVAADIVAKATSFGFDASDLMPAAVGAGAEWTQLTSWIQGNGTNPTTQSVLQAIDAAWPK